MVGCFAYGDTVLVERFIDGVEVAVAVVERDGGVRKRSPRWRSSPKAGCIDYTARDTAGLTDFFTPARLPKTPPGRWGELAVAAIGYSVCGTSPRTDAIVAGDGTVQFLEVASSPGLTETSTVPMAIEASGASLGAVFTDLVARAIRRPA